MVSITPFQIPIQSSLSAGLQEMPYFRFSVKDLTDKKSKKDEDIIYHLEMDKGQSEHFNGGRVGKKLLAIVVFAMFFCMRQFGME